MRLSRHIALLVLCTSCGSIAGVASAGETVETANYSITRQGGVLGTHGQIGTYVVEIARDGPNMDVNTTTHTRVRQWPIVDDQFNQTVKEHWVGGRLQELDATTRHNDSEHHVTASGQGTNIIVRNGGEIVGNAPAAVVPFNLWNAALAQATASFDLEDGTEFSLSARDLGQENVSVQGHFVATHHYRLVEKNTHDVWYDATNRLLRVEETESDGSTIIYLLN